jgi:dienelactone hydrolase
MAELVAFHHALGLTDPLRRLAAAWRDAGHTVHTPDLFEGRVFDSIGAGMAYAEDLGFPRGIIDRGVEIAEELPAELVYLGFSLGVLPAQYLAQRRPGARGAVLVYSCVPPAEFGGPWPEGVPLQVHGGEHDPIFRTEGDLEAARAIVESTDQAELYLYPVSVHYFADASLPSYHQPSADLLGERVRRFLADR